MGFEDYENSVFSNVIFKIKFFVCVCVCGSIGGGGWGEKRKKNLF